ncbi:MAG: peptidyl-prolyl cis-trans isomerase [Alphaproteobacteria bacterium]
MMGVMRSFLKTPWAVGLLVLLAASFGIFGFKDPFNGVVGGGFMSAGDRSIQPRDANRMVDQAIDQIRKEQGKVISRREAGEQGIPQQVMQDLTMQTVTLAYADKIGVKASASAAADIIAKAPLFKDGLGNIDQNAITKYASDQGMTVPQFEKDLQDQVTFGYLQQAVIGGVSAPKILSTPLLVFLGEKRTVALARFTPTAMPTVTPPTDAELKTFYESKKAMFAQPERRRFAVLSYSPDDFLDKVKIDDATLKTEYDKRIKEFSTPETREIAQFASADGDAIQAVVDKVKQGAKIEDAVNQTKGVTLATISVKPGDLKDKNQDQAAFTFAVGEPFGPIKSGDGYIGMQVVKVTPGIARPLEQVTDDLRKELAMRDAQHLYDATDEKFLDYISGGKSLEEVASDIGAPIMLFPAVDQRATDMERAPNALLSKHPKELQDAFKLKVGEMSQVIEGDGERIVLRLDEIVPASTPPLDQVKAEVKQLYVSEKQLEAAQKVANDVVAAVKGGKKFDDVAKAAKMDFVRPTQAISRAVAQQQLPDPKIISVMFGLPEGGIASVVSSQGDPWIIMVDKIEKATADQADPQLLKQVNDALQRSITNDVFQSFSRGVQQEVKVRSNGPEIQKFIEGFTKDSAG